MGPIDLLSALAAQTVASPDSTIADGGTITVASIILALAGAVATLARAYVKARDARDKMAGETMDKVMALVEAATKSTTLQTASNEQLVKALESLDRRLGRLEEKSGAQG